jgi:hypothetical protein
LLRAIRNFLRRLWRPLPMRARGVSALGIPLLAPVELRFDEAEATPDPIVPNRPEPGTTELALDLEALLLAHDPAEARTTAVAPEDLSMLSFQRRRS